MKCPKCQGDMETVSHQGVEVDRCGRCEGLWFDAAERDTLLRIEGAEVVDSGSALKTAGNLLLNIQCPRCAVRMTHMVDDKQIHIHFEQCPSCGGQFFDAGEFRDLKDLTVVESFFAKLRQFRKTYLP